MYKKLLSINKTNINSPRKKGKRQNRQFTTKWKQPVNIWKDAQFPSHQRRQVKTRNDFSTNRFERKLRPLLTRLGGCERVTLPLPESCETCTAFLDGKLSTTIENTLHLGPAIPLSPSSGLTAAQRCSRLTELHRPSSTALFPAKPCGDQNWALERQDTHQATCTPPSPHASLRRRSSLNSLKPFVLAVHLCPFVIETKEISEQRELFLWKPSWKL